jgi:hypothetical protein
MHQIVTYATAKSGCVRRQIKKSSAPMASSTISQPWAQKPGPETETKARLHDLDALGGHATGGFGTSIDALIDAEKRLVCLRQIPRKVDSESLLFV